MTKKSSARLQRDATAKQATDYTKKNTGWDDTHALYEKYQNHLNFMYSKVTKFFDIENIGSFIPLAEREYASSVVSGFAKDIKSFQGRLNALYNQHKSRKGHVDVEAGDYIFMVQLISAYQAYNRDAEMILSPMFTQVMGLIQSIESNIQRAVAAQNAAAAEAAAQAEPAAQI